MAAVPDHKPGEEQGDPPRPPIHYEQQSLFQEQLLKEDNTVSFRLIGQVFGTFWLIEWKDELLIIDQHAAHEKILYENIRKELEHNHVYSQNLAGMNMPFRLFRPIFFTWHRRNCFTASWTSC